MDSGSLTFIPYISHGQGSQRRRELLRAEARKHAAAIAHHRAKISGARNSNEAQVSGRTCGTNGQQTLSSKPSCITGSFKVTPARKSIWRSSVREEEAVEPCDEGEDLETVLEKLSAAVAKFDPVNRNTGWFFGSIGTAGRSLGDLDLVAIKYFLKDRRGQFVGASLLKSSSVANAPSMISSDLFGRAIQGTALLDSLIAFSAFAMASQYAGAGVLRNHGYRASNTALKAVREGLLHYHHDPSLILPYAILHLGMAVISLGDTDAACVHLRLLVNLTQNMDTRVWAEYRFLMMVKALDLRYAILSERQPLTSIYQLSRMSSVSQRACQPAGSEASATEADTFSAVISSLVEPRASTTHATETTQIPPVPTPSSTSTILESQTTTIVATAREEFHDAVTQQVISPYLLEIVDQYLQTAESISRLSQMLETRSSTYLEMWDTKEKAFACLDRVCTQWYQMCDTRTSGAYFSTISQDGRDKSNAASQGLFDHALMITFQFHLLDFLGKYPGVTLSILASRLQSYLERDRVVENILCGQKRAKQAKLVLWILLTGVSATDDGRSIVHNWFCDQAARLLEQLKLHAEEDVLGAMAAFSLVNCAPREDFVQAVQKVVGYM